MAPYLDLGPCLPDVGAVEEVVVAAFLIWVLALQGELPVLLVLLDLQLLP